MDDIKLKPCPFCGGSARITAKRMEWYGRPESKERRCIWTVRGMCNKCFSMGKGIKTEEMFLFDEDGHCLRNGFRDLHKPEVKKAFMPYMEAAADAWNRRPSDD